MKPIIVLAMHGTPPADFPPREMAEFMGLHARQHAASASASEAQERRYGELEASLRAWPRTQENDPYYFGSQELAEHLRRITGSEVLVGFNEFCAPGLD